MTIDELDAWREQAFREVATAARIRNVVFYAGLAGVFLLGMLAEYALTHFV